MPKRPVDTIRVEGPGGTFDRFEAVSIVNSIDGQTEARFSLGDDTAWQALEAVVAPGEEFTVFVNDRPRMKGRSEAVEAPGSARDGWQLEMICRTKMADARYRSAEVSTRVENATLKDFVLKLYEPLGYAEADFLFAEATARDLMTGKSSGGKPPVDLAKITLQQAKVNPPETIRDCAERHLKRHHMTHWDAPDGRILVGSPDDEQPATYRAICKRGGPASRGNNVLTARPIRDWGEVASRVEVFGQSPGKDITRSAVRGVSEDPDLAAVFARTGHFNRAVYLPAEQVKEIAHAEAQAARERAMRARRKNAWEFSFDGWAYWDGDTATPWVHNTTIDVDVETVGGSCKGKYLIHRVELRVAVREAPTTKVAAVAKGIWVL